jgi:hypothetical protein
VSASQLVAFGLLAALNLWAILMWRGQVARKWIEKQAGRETWGVWSSPSYLTTAAPSWAVGWDLLAASIPTGRWLNVGGRDIGSFLIVIPALVFFGLAFLVGAWDRPRWALPPWYRDWKRRRDARGHDANHEVEIICADDDKFDPYAYALCSCEWMSDVVPVRNDDFARAIAAATAAARQHSRTVQSAVIFPLRRPTGAPEYIGAADR